MNHGHFANFLIELTSRFLSATVAGSRRVSPCLAMPRHASIRRAPRRAGRGRIIKNFRYLVCSLLVEVGLPLVRLYFLACIYPGSRGRNLFNLSDMIRYVDSSGRGKVQLKVRRGRGRTEGKNRSAANETSGYLFHFALTANIRSYKWRRDRLRI